jgi:hypothetical protein
MAQICLPEKPGQHSTHNVYFPWQEICTFPNNLNDYKVNIRGTEEEVEESQRVELNHITAPLVALKYPLELREHSFPRSHRFLKSALALKAEVRKIYSQPSMYASVVLNCLCVMPEFPACFRDFFQLMMYVTLHTIWIAIGMAIDITCGVRQNLQKYLRTT